MLPLDAILKGKFFRNQNGKSDNIFKNGPRKICGRQPLKNLK